MGAASPRKSGAGYSFRKRTNFRSCAVRGDSPCHYRSLVLTFLGLYEINRIYLNVKDDQILRLNWGSIQLSCFVSYT